MTRAGTSRRHARIARRRACEMVVKSAAASRGRCTTLMVEKARRVVGLLRSEARGQSPSPMKYTSSAYGPCRWMRCSPAIAATTIQMASPARSCCPSTPCSRTCAPRCAACSNPRGQTGRVLPTTALLAGDGAGRDVLAHRRSPRPTRQHSQRHARALGARGSNMGSLTGSAEMVTHAVSVWQIAANTAARGILSTDDLAALRARAPTGREDADADRRQLAGPRRRACRCWSSDGVRRTDDH
jgi:hypothetical protein